MQTLSALNKPSELRANKFSAAFNMFSAQIDILSLDCFDTLIWRKTASPMDVFIHLQQQPQFNQLGLSALLRSMNETRARSAKYVKQGSTEVTLQEIYQYIFPELDEKIIATLMHEEISAELAVCYAFPPTLDLIRLAKSHNKKIIIVSDTYFTKAQLTFLLQTILPHDVFAAIDDVFSSAECGVSKSQGLFNVALNTLKCQSNQILHLGDNSIADFSAPSALKIPALYFTQTEHHLEQLANMRNWSACFFDSAIRHTRACPDVWRGLFACKEFPVDAAEQTIGYISLGQIMYAFAQFLQREVDALQQNGNKPKVLFLMRDGCLISKTCAKLFGETFGKPIRISRFSAYAASFRSKNDVSDYLAEHAISQKFSSICRQLLLSDDQTKKIISKTESASDKIATFMQLVCEEETLHEIITQSQHYFNRLISYLKKYADFSPSDTLVFVDLGYRGTAQRKLAPLFKQSFNATILGRYLIALREPNASLSHRGLIDASWCDDRTLSMLVNYIALFEQMNTSHECSVVNYDETGEPVFADNTLKTQQHDKLHALQHACLQFVTDADHFATRANLKLQPVELRDLAAAELVRLLFLPSQAEIQYLQSFQFDVNLGTSKTIPVFDVQQGLDDLRKRGLFYMEKNLETMRTNYPAELRAASLESSFTLLAQERFKGKIQITETSFRREILPIILIANGESSCQLLEAIPTFDGYFALHIPVKAYFNVAVQFGQAYRWVEIYSAHLIPTRTYLTDQESEHACDVRADLIANHMVEHDKNLFECQSSASLMALMKLQDKVPGDAILRIVFRSLVKKASPRL